MADRKPKTKRALRRARIKRSVRRKVSGTAERPRLTVFRSNKNIHAQLIDDVVGHTVAAASSLEQGIAAESPTEVGRQVGTLLAERAADAGIEVAVFDRNGYSYHGRIKSLADGARSGGLHF